MILIAILVICVANFVMTCWLVGLQYRVLAQTPGPREPSIVPAVVARVMSSGAGRDLLRKRLQERLDAIPRGNG
jgi:hypothetical protein